MDLLNFYGDIQMLIIQIQNINIYFRELSHIFNITAVFQSKIEIGYLHI